MANRLKVAKAASTHDLHAQGWSQRRIARELGVSRGAVARHLRTAANEAKAPTGSGDRDGASKRATSSAKAPTGSRSLCESYRELILEKLLGSRSLSLGIRRHANPRSAIRSVRIAVAPLRAPRQRGCQR